MPYLISREEFIAHHGIKGQKWGVRRYRNADGTLTEAGKKRYQKEIAKAEAEQYKALQKDHSFSSYRNVHGNVYELGIDIMETQLRNTSEYKRYSKALHDLEMYEQDYLGRNNTRYNIERLLNDKKWARLKDELANADVAYSSKIGKVYLENSDRLISAKLRDLNLPDDASMRELYKDVMRERFPTLTEETRLKLML